MADALSGGLEVTLTVFDTDEGPYRIESVRGVNGV